MSLLVFELHGVYVFDYDGEVPPSLARHYNEFEGRYEVPSADDLDALPVAYDVVDPADYRVRFRGDPPEAVAEAALLVEDGPMSTTVLCPDEGTVDRALDAGGERVEETP